MTSYNDKRAKARERLQAELEKIDREEAVARYLPVEPKSIFPCLGFKPPQIWVCYEAPTLSAAANVLRQFDLLEVSNIKDGCVYRYPMELQEESRRGKPVSNTWYVELRQAIGKGFSTFEVAGYARIGYRDAAAPNGAIVRVIVELKRPCYQGSTVSTPYLDYKYQVPVHFAWDPNSQREILAVNGTPQSLKQQNITRFGNQGTSIDWRFEYQTADKFFEFADNTEVT